MLNLNFLHRRQLQRPAVNHKHKHPKTGLREWHGNRQECHFLNIGHITVKNKAKRVFKDAIWPYISNKSISCLDILQQYKTSASK